MKKKKKIRVREVPADKPKTAAQYICYWLCVAIAAAFAVLYFKLGWKDSLYNISQYLDAAVRSVLVLFFCSAIQKIIYFVIIKMRAGSKHAKTVASLLASIVKYALGIAAIVVCITFFIEDPTELFSSLGILALVVGLGCESLISDVVAGIFLVLEGEFEVGDIIIYDDWRGTVREIGLRTTKIEDISGSIKIINNSNITEITNKSKTLSLAVCRYGISGDVEVENLETVISDNIEGIREKIPAIAEGPDYKGIDEIGEASYVILITAKCKEEDKFQVQRDINREIKAVFDANEIAFADGDEEE